MVVPVCCAAGSATRCAAPVSMSVPVCVVVRVPLLLLVGGAAALAVGGGGPRVARWLGGGSWSAGVVGKELRALRLDRG